VVAAAFVLATFGWGIGFYGPPVFLREGGETRGWPLALISAAVTLHFFTSDVRKLSSAVARANTFSCVGVSNSRITAP
jgi:hypothetical protein